MSDFCKLATKSLSIEVAPEFGAKIVSVRNLMTGREWMWRPSPDAPLFRNKTTDPFDTGPLIGADECLPTIAPCHWHGRYLPDHGELWARAWQLEESTTSRIRTSIRLHTLPLTFERTISVEQNQALFEYALTSSSKHPEHFLWAFHPLMPIQEGDRIELARGIRSVLVASAQGFEKSDAVAWDWPEPMAGVHLDRIDFGRNVPAYVKLFVDFRQSQEGTASIRRGGERLSFRFDPAQVPFLGLWLTRGGWNGYTHMALEPTNAPHDLLTAAAAFSSTAIAPSQTLRWSFCLCLETL